ncbi:MAG: radical SAM protein [Candidatus Edwardsbacteria bacterium]
MTKSPYFVDWAITKECNLHCIHCTGMMDSELNTDEALRVVDEIAELKPGWVNVEGGEALLRKDIFTILSKMKQKKLETYLITNAQLMDEEKVKKLKELGIKILISVDGADSITYEEIKRGASWEKVLKNAKLASKADILHGITVVLSKRNCHQIKEFISLAEVLKAKVLIFIGLQPFIPAETFYELTLTNIDYQSTIQQVTNLMKETKLKIFFDEPFFWPMAKKLSGGTNPLLVKEEIESGIVVNEVKGCILGDYIYIQTNGDVRPCMFAPKELTFGNVQSEPLIKLWDKMQRHPLLSHLKRQELRKGKCKECECFNECGGCPIRVFGYTREWFESDPACPV